MTQLIIDTDTGGGNITLPESINNGYSVAREPLYVDVEMYSGRLTREMRGYVWRVSYQYGYFDETTKNALIAACEKGITQPIKCSFLQQGAQSPYTLTEGWFLVTSFKRPRFMWGRGNTPIWADFRVELREVTPHD